MDRSRIPIIVLWLVCLSSFLFESGSAIATYGQLAFWCLVVVHAIECLIYLPTIHRAKGSFLGHLFNTFIFGYFYFLELRSLIAEADAEGE